MPGDFFLGGGEALVQAVGGGGLGGGGADVKGLGVTPGGCEVLGVKGPGSRATMAVALGVVQVCRIPTLRGMC